MRPHPLSIYPGLAPQNSETDERGFRPEGAYYYSSDSEMSKSDGTVLVEAVYNYEQATGSSMLYITLGGVALSFDLKNEEAQPVSEADGQRLEAWAATEDAALLQDVSIALIEEGAQQNYQEPLLNFYTVAMLVDFAPPTASGLRPAKRLKRSHHAVSHGSAMGLTSAQAPRNCLGPKRSAFIGTRNAQLVSGSASKNAITAAQCYGCCGYGCYCLPGRRCGVTRLYTAPCSAHDACVRQRGWWQCMREFTRAAVSVWVCNYGY